MSILNLSIINLSMLDPERNSNLIGSYVTNAT